MRDEGIRKRRRGSAGASAPITMSGCGAYRIRSSVTKIRLMQREVVFSLTH